MLISKYVLVVRLACGCVEAEEHCVKLSFCFGADKDTWGGRWASLCLYSEH